MSNDEQERLSEAMAARLWQRAAELQVEAARQSDTACSLEAESEISAEDTTGYSLADVRRAAEGAGIAGQFVDAALAEVAASSAVGEHESSLLDKIALRLLKSPSDFLEVRRAMAASAEDVYRAMQVVFPAAPYYLTLRDIQGDAVHGGIMVFDVPAVTVTRWVYDLSYTGMKRLTATIRRVDDTSCEVVVRGSLRRGRRIAGGVFGTVTAGAAGLGALAGGVGLGVVVGAGLGIGTLGLGALAAGLGLVGGTSLGGASRAMSRKLYSFFLDRGLLAMEQLLDTLNLSVVSNWRVGGPPAGIGTATSQGLRGKPTK